MKKILLIIPLLLLLIGCSSKHEDDKFAYIECKNKIEKQEEFISQDSLDFNTFFNIERNGDTVNYSLTIDNPKINMHNIKALLIHDYDTIDTYPSIGIFDKTGELYQDSDKTITLNGTIISSDDLSDVNFKLYLEYTTDNEKKEEIYYEVQRG